MNEAVLPDRWLGGNLLLCQPACGHRAGTDAVLLAAAVADVSGKLVDAGSGVGPVGLAMALRGHDMQVALVESDPGTAEMARQNIDLNGFSARMRVHETDVMDAASRRAAGLVDGWADIVMTNPPYYQAGQVRASPHAGQAAAHVLAQGDLLRWIAACLALLRPGGTFAMIHRPAALNEILDACARRLGAIVILPIHPHDGAMAGRIIVKGRKGSRAGLAILPGLVLHRRDGRFTETVEAMHRGQGLIAGF